MYFFILISSLLLQNSVLPPKPRTIEDVINTVEYSVVSRLAPTLNANNIDLNKLGGLTLIYLKKEQRLEVWGNVKDNNVFIIAYPQTAMSGTIGPKYKEGDKQIPEGIYRLTHFNPNSLYHLSLGVNYPNKQDIEWAKQDGRPIENLGGDIMIHGKNVTIGCVPLGDTAIEELFYMVYKVGIHRTDIIMSPVDFRITDYQSRNQRENQRYKQIKNYMKNFIQ